MGRVVSTVVPTMGQIETVANVLPILLTLCRRQSENIPTIGIHSPGFAALFYFNSLGSAESLGTRTKGDVDGRLLI